jgi:dynein heavy chain
LVDHASVCSRGSFRLRCPLLDFNLPKLVDEDKPIFRELIGDLFPGLGNTERKFDPKLQEAIVQVAGARGLQAEETFVLKCVELAELLAIRHSVFVIGPAGCGKSEIWKTLLGAFKLQGLKCAYEVINPKAIRNNELGAYTRQDRRAEESRHAIACATSTALNIVLSLSVL